MSALLLSLCAPPARAAESETGQLFKAPGATLYYEIRGAGKGTPLVLVNGGPGYDHTYLHRSTAWDELAKSRPVVFYDQRGNGRSPALASGQTCTLRDQVADLEALRQHLGFERIDLLGHSWGGYLVMAYAARHPEHVAHLVICDSAAPRFADTVFLFKDVYPENSTRQEERAFAEAMGDKTPHETEQREYFSMLFYSPEKRDAFIAAGSAPFNRQVNEAIVADLEHYDLNPEIRKFRFPTLVLTGRFDMNVAPAVAWKIHRAIPNSRFKAFERSGHLPFYEEPAEFIRILEGFLAAP